LLGPTSGIDPNVSRFLGLIQAKNQLQETGKDGEQLKLMRKILHEQAF
jgi:hypothetical protein